MTVKEVRDRLTYSEMEGWIRFLTELEETEIKRFARLEVGLAVVAREVRRSYVENPNTVPLDDFLLREKEVPKAKTKKEAAQISKGIWGSIFGMNLN